MIIRKILFMVCTMLYVVSCSPEGDDIYVDDDTTEDEEYTSSSAQTTLIYFCGTSLVSYFKNNIYDIEDAVADGGLGDNGRIFYCIRLTSSGATQLNEIYRDGSSYNVRSVKTYDSSIYWNDSGMLAQVIEDTKSEIGESSALNLIVSGHGTGWVLQDHPYLKSVVDDEYESIWTPVEGALPTRFMGSSKDGYMEMSELSSELELSGTKFGYIIFDMCLMSSIEALYRIRNYADYIIASPAEVMSYGFPYEDILKYMFYNDGLSYNIGKICEEYINFYSSYAVPCGTIATCVTSELDALTVAISELTLNELSTAEKSALQTYEGLSTHVLYDLDDYIMAAAVDTLESFAIYTEAFERAFPSEYKATTGYFYTALGSSGKKSITSYSGVSTSAPSSMFRDDWNAEPWAIATTNITDEETEEAEE